MDNTTYSKVNDRNSIGLNNIIIWGTGKCAANLLEWIRHIEELCGETVISDKIVGFVDSYNNDTSYANKPIYAPKYLHNSEITYICVIAMLNYDEPERYLRFLGKLDKIDYYNIYDFSYLILQYVKPELIRPGESIKNLPPYEIVSKLKKTYCYGVNAILPNLKNIVSGAGSYDSKNNFVKTNIALFLGIYGIGGAERVCSQLIPMYLDNGYEVILFTRRECDREYELDNRATHVRLKHSHDTRRFKELYDCLRKYEINVACFHIPYQGVDLAYDVLLTKMMGIRTIIESHTCFEFYKKNRSLLDLSINTYRVCDQLIVLSRVDEAIWSYLQVNARYIPNPIIKTNRDSQPSSIKRLDNRSKKEKIILWVGRCIQEQKRILDVVPIMKNVLRFRSDVKLMIMGDGKDLPRLKQIVRDNELDEYFIFLGRRDDLEQGYSIADVMLVTSEVEGFPMALSEAQCYGLPVVMYDMPYLELVRNGAGVISVPQGDVIGASNAVVEVLTDERKYNALSDDALRCTDYFNEYDYMACWRKAFKKGDVSVSDMYDYRNEETIINRMYIQHS